MPRTSLWKRIGGITALISSFFHLFPGIGGLLNPEFSQRFYGEATAQVSTFLVGLGVFQLAWVWVLFKSSSRVLLGLGILGFLGSIALYFVSLTTPLPLGVPQQRIDEFSAFAFATKAVEGIFVISALNVLRSMSK